MQSIAPGLRFRNIIFVQLNNITSKDSPLEHPAGFPKSNVLSRVACIDWTSLSFKAERKTLGGVLRA